MRDPLLARLGIQSWCFRKYGKVDELLPELKRCGADHLEICPLHFDVMNPDASIDACRAAGVTINGCGVNFFGEDEKAARKLFEYAEKAALPALSADFDPARAAEVERLADEYGRKLAVHNHGRKHRLGSVAALEELFNRTSETIGLCLDTAWMLDSGEDPLKVAKRFRDRLYGVHLKDFVFDRAGKPEDVVVGTGNLDLAGLMKYLRDTGFDGYLTLEYEGDVDDPVPALAKCVEAILTA